MTDHISKIPFLCSSMDLSKYAKPVFIEKKNSMDMSHVLITGANGFLALFLIEQLSSNSKVQSISCFVRSIDKFRKEKEKLGLFFKEDKIKFVIFNDFFAQSEIEKISYLETVTQFIHNAAQVNNLKTAGQLWDSNVILAEKFLLLWQQTKHDASFHLISTLSVFASSLTEPFNLEKNTRKVVKEVFLMPNNKNLLAGGYAQTKWVCEHLLSKYKNSHIIRLGLLTPSTTNTLFRENEFLTHFFNLIKSLEFLPHNNASNYKVYASTVFLDLSPVNEVSNNILNLLGQKKISHIANSKSLDLYSIEPGNKPYLSNKEWEDYIDLKKISKINKILLKNAFLRYKFLSKNILYFNLDLFQSSRHDWSHNNAIISHPETILKCYLTHETKS